MDADLFSVEREVRAAFATFLSHRRVQAPGVQKEVSMKFFQPPGKGIQFFLLALSLLGVGITIYLTSVHYENVPLVCSESGLINCARVISSAYSVVPGTALPITIPGLGWCVVAASLAIAGLSTKSGLWQRRIRWTQFIWALSGMLVVLYLVYAEIVRLHTICAWCTALHILILIMFLITLVQLQSMPSGATVSDETEFEETENENALPHSR